MKKFTFKNLHFSSDLHLNHDPDWPVPIWRQRGFECVQDMNAAIIDSLNSMDGDILLLGDFCLNTSEEQFYAFLRQIKNPIYTLLGNHPSPIRRILQSKNGDYDVWPTQIENMTVLGHYFKFVYQKQLIECSHFPYSIWDEQKRGAWCITGHSHGGFPDTRPENKFGKILDVGWDIFKRPISFEELKKIMDKKQYVRKDGHH